MAGEAAPNDDKLLDVYLAKYGSLRGELFQRFQFQGQAFNFLIVVLTAVVIAGASQVERGNAELFARFLLVLPLMTAPLGYLYLANDLVIFGIIGYIARDLSDDVSRLLGRDVSLTDARFDHLGGPSLQAHRFVAYGRWMLFLLPTLLPLVYVVFFTRAWRDYPFSLLLAVDCVLAGALLWATGAAAREQAQFRHRHSATVDRGRPPRRS